MCPFAAARRRQPLTVQAPTKPGEYPSVNATLYLGWGENGMARQRYDFKKLVLGLDTSQARLWRDRGEIVVRS